MTTLPAAAVLVVVVNGALVAPAAERLLAALGPETVAEMLCSRGKEAMTASGIAADLAALVAAAEVRRRR